MNFKDFFELQNYIRRYNAISLLEIGSVICWEKRYTPYHQSDDFLMGNTLRNYSIRLMLLASAGNKHRNSRLTLKEFGALIDCYHRYENKILNEKLILQESQNLLDNINEWENSNSKKSNNWKILLSNLLSIEIEKVQKIMSLIPVQRIGAFQNAGFGQPLARMLRIMKFINLLKKYSKDHFLETFTTIENEIDIYGNHIMVCLGCFGQFSKTKGFYDFSNPLDIEKEAQIQYQVTIDSLHSFIQGNSLSFFKNEPGISFRTKTNQLLRELPAQNQPFFQNLFLEYPLIHLDRDRYCLPDPFSLTESFWNQIQRRYLGGMDEETVRGILSQAFEEYLNMTFLPLIAESFFEKIQEVKNPQSQKDKRADFLVNLPSCYIIIECKNSLMSLQTSSHFDPKGLADLWCRIHIASEQISATIKALDLQDKPVIPLIITFYDSLLASYLFEQMALETDYCSILGFSIPPIVRSLHEFEHWLSDRSLNNWAELILQQQTNSSIGIKPDNQGHGYKHLNSLNFAKNFS
jgi:hypothetical protein